MKKKRIILMIIILMFVILIYLLVNINSLNNKNPKEKDLKYIYNTKVEGNINIMPTNVDKIFVKYKGNIDQRSIYKALDLFVNEFVEKYYNETKIFNDENEINNYFNENKIIIEKELGINNEKDFNSFCGNLKENLNSDTLELLSYTMNPETIKNEDGCLNCVMLINYNNNQKVGFQISIKNTMDKEKTPIEYKACEDKEKLQYEYEKNDYETPKSIVPTGRVI